MKESFEREIEIEKIRTEAKSVVHLFFSACLSPVMNVIDIMIV